jgi:HAD superfamily hydrolase (TIGR01509 family)
MSSTAPGHRPGALRWRWPRHNRAMLAQGFSALLLDLDGTLVDSEPRHCTAHRQFLASQGIEASEEIIYGNIGKGDREFFTVLARMHDRQIDALDWCRRKTAILMSLYASEPLSVRAGVANLLDHAQKLGMRSCVVTSSERAVADLALRSSGLQARLPLRICYEDTAEHKPDPAPYLLATERLGVRAAECLAIEDSISGVRSAATAGITVIGFAGLVPAADLMRAGAARSVLDLNEVL